MTTTWLLVLILVHGPHGFAMDTKEVQSEAQCRQFGEQWNKQMTIVEKQGTWSENQIYGASFRCVKLEAR